MKCHLKVEVLNNPEMGTHEVCVRFDRKCVYCKPMGDKITHHNTKEYGKETNVPITKHDFVGQNRLPLCASVQRNRENTRLGDCATLQGWHVLGMHPSRTKLGNASRSCQPGVIIISPHRWARVRN